ncbi:MAG: penicillin-binding protein [Myxococcota bacterium]
MKPLGRAPARSGAKLGVAAPRVSAKEQDARLLATARARAGTTLVGLCGFLALLGVRAAWVMGVPDPRLEERGREQFQSAVEYHGRRGALLDRNGRVLATTVNLPALYANPSKISEDQLRERIARISQATGRTEAWIAGRFAATNTSGKRLQEIRLGDSLDPATAKDIVTGLERDQMWLVDEPVRTYPGKDLAAPLVGFTDNTGDGAAGLEKVLQHELAGETYRVLVARDRKGRAIDPGADNDRLARPGRSVRLTVDAAIQHAAEVALDKAMVASAPEAAMAVVVDVDSGAILAMANRPSGNPNDGASRARQEVFKNHAAMDQIEPGSVMKPFVVAAALEEGLVTPDMPIDCELGSWAVGGRVIRDDHPKGVISVTEIVKYSSNVGTAKIGLLLGAERVHAYLKDFGFGRATGLSLPGEVGGALRSAATMRTIELATTSFGQGMTSSPVQLASALATLANGGVRMQPYLVDAVLDRDGAVETRRDPRVDRRVVSEDVARIVTAMMETVIEDGGTGTRARVPGYRVAGKTGTAQKVENGVYSPTKRVSSFVGFLPADRPEIAVAVSVDSPTIGSKYGGIVAAPVFAEIGAFSMRYLGVPPDAPVTGEPVVEEPSPVLAALEIVSDGAGGWILPDLRGRSLRDALAGLGPAGVTLQVDGYGRVAEQEPAPGARVVPGDAVRLRFN